MRLKLTRMKGENRTKMKKINVNEDLHCKKINAIDKIETNLLQPWTVLVTIWKHKQWPAMQGNLQFTCNSF